MPAAQYQLGLMYARGAGVPKNDARACAWISVAAALGYEAATAWVAEMESVIPAETQAEAQRLSDKLFALL